eukprot:14234358-Heterocapsa_arctica.AAC.1
MEKLIKDTIMLRLSCTEVNINAKILAVLITTKCGTKGQIRVETRDHCGECGIGKGKYKSPTE